MVINHLEVRLGTILQPQLQMDKHPLSRSGCFSDPFHPWPKPHGFQLKGWILTPRILPPSFLVFQKSTARPQPTHAKLQVEPKGKERWDRVAKLLMRWLPPSSGGVFFSTKKRYKKVHPSKLNGRFTWRVHRVCKRKNPLNQTVSTFIFGVPSC